MKFKVEIDGAGNALTAQLLAEARQKLAAALEHMGREGRLDQAELALGALDSEMGRLQGKLLSFLAERRIGPGRTERRRATRDRRLARSRG